jgi:hypothetical protein
LDGRTIRDVLAGARDHDWCIEDLRGNCCDRDVLGCPADQHDALPGCSNPIPASTHCAARPRSSAARWCTAPSQ